MYTTIKHLVKTLLDRRPRMIIKTVELPPSRMLEQRCALVTGGTSGIGLSISWAFLQAGASIVMTGRNQDKLSKVKTELEQAFPSSKIIAFRLDNSDVSSFAEGFQRILSLLEAEGIPVVDILVNNAGVNAAPMPEAREAEYDAVMDTNLKGAFFLSQLVGRYMKANHIRGNILNIGSASCLRPGNSAYILSKWGIRSLTLGLAKALGKDGITVNGIAPGPTATPMMTAGDKADLGLERIPLGRYIMPEEVANMAVILVSDYGRAIMGDMIYMTGGAGNLSYDDVPYSF